MLPAKGIYPLLDGGHGVMEVGSIHDGHGKGFLVSGDDLIECLMEMAMRGYRSVGPL